MTPDLQQMFPKFKDVPRDQLEGNSSYQAHTLGVVKTVQFGVKSLNDIPALSNALQKLGKRHSKYGVKSPHFEVSNMPRNKIAVGCIVVVGSYIEGCHKFEVLSHFSWKSTATTCNLF